MDMVTLMIYVCNKLGVRCLGCSFNTFTHLPYGFYVFIFIDVFDIIFLPFFYISAMSCNEINK